MESSLAVELFENVNSEKEDNSAATLDITSKLVANEHQAAFKSQASEVENLIKCWGDIEVGNALTTEVASKWSENVVDSHVVETAAELAFNFGMQTQSTISQQEFDKSVEWKDQETVKKNNSIIVTAEVHKSSNDQSGKSYDEDMCIGLSASSSSDSEIDQFEVILGDENVEGEHGIEMSNGNIPILSHEVVDSKEHQAGNEITSAGEAESIHKNTSHSLSTLNDDEAQMQVDFYSSELLRRKGFNLNSFNNVRQLVNLLNYLTVKDTDCTLNEIQCINLPHHMRENHLIPLFDKFGNIYRLRMSFKDKNQNLSEAFVTYTTQGEADDAFKNLHGREVQGHIVCVAKFIPDLRVLVKPIPPSASENEIFQKFKFTVGLLKVTFSEKDHKNQGFCFLHYKNFDMTCNAQRFISNQTYFGRKVTAVLPKKRMSGMFSEDSERVARKTNKKLLGNKNVAISHSPPATKITGPIPIQAPGHNGVSRTLYISNLRAGIRSSDLRKALSVYGEIGHVDKDDNFASVEFRNVEDSKRAAREIDKKLLGNENVEISHSPPATKMNDPLPRQTPAGNNDASRTLYITNLRSDIRSSDLRKVFSVYGEIGHIHKDDNFASVEFRNVEDSKRAAREIDKKLLGKENDEVSHSKPPTKMYPIVTKTSHKLNNVPLSHTSGYVNKSRSKQDIEGQQISLHKEIDPIKPPVITVDKTGIWKHLKLLFN